MLRCEVIFAMQRKLARTHIESLLTNAIMAINSSSVFGSIATAFAKYCFRNCAFFICEECIAIA